MKSVRDIKLEFLQKKIENLAKENLDFKQKIEALNLQLAIYRGETKFDKNVDAYSEMIMAKKEYEKLCDELKEKLKGANELINNCKILLNKEGTNFEKQVNKEINRMKNWN